MMRVLEYNEAKRIVIANLRLNSQALNLSSPEAIAATVRKVAGFICPCSASTLTAQVGSLLRGLVDDEYIQSIPDIINDMTSYGDLLELTSVDEGQMRKLLYAGPPAFVKLEPGALLLLGIVPDYFSPLPSDLESRITYRRHVRRIDSISGDDLTILNKSGLMEFSLEYWLCPPYWLSTSKQITAHKFIQAIDRELDQTQEVDLKEDVLIMKPTENPRFYKQRWSPIHKSVGRFIARRPRKYGNALWSYLEIKNGKLTRALNLPLERSNGRGCDDAWYIQMALDAINGSPQLFRVSKTDHEQFIFDFYSPVPRWVLRKWDSIGQPIKSKDSLFAYRFKSQYCQSEVKFCQTNLWLKQMA